MSEDRALPRSSNSELYGRIVQLGLCVPLISFLSALFFFDSFISKLLRNMIEWFSRAFIFQTVPWYAFRVSNEQSGGLFGMETDEQ